MPDHRTSPGDGLAVLSQLFVNDGTFGETLKRVAELACETAPADFAGITMLVEGRARTGVFTDPLSPEVDASQYESGRGPCLEAFRSQHVMRIDDMSSEVRWPEFGRSAAALGIASVLSLPLGARGEPLGALNLYSRTTGAFDEQTAERLADFSGQAAIVLTNSLIYWDARQLSENLSQAIRSRATIDHAIGIIMAQGGKAPDEAFQVLVRASQRENRKLRHVAAEFVERVQQRRPGVGSGVEVQDPVQVHKAEQAAD